MTLSQFPREDASRVATGRESGQVLILMAVHNGADCLPEQLESIAGQEYENWHLLASDDHSSDRSAEELQAFSIRHPGHVTCFDGPQCGAAQNFLFLVRKAAERLPPGGWLAFSDQDDIWLPERLTSGIAALEKYGNGEPALYCSRTWITDHYLEARRLSDARPRPPSFRNALVQNIAPGNTILLNPAAAQLAASAAAEVSDIVMHDWWLYQLITGAGGAVVHDDAPTLLYRQHAGNQIGANDRMRARLKRLCQLLRGDFRAWNERNIAALRASAHRLSPENRALLEGFAAMRDRALPGRLLTMARLGLYRQSIPSQLALWLATMLGRL